MQAFKNFMLTVVFLLAAFDASAAISIHERLEDIIRRNQTYDTIGDSIIRPYQQQLRDWDVAYGLEGQQSFSGFSSRLRETLIGDDEFMQGEYLKGAIRPYLWRNIVAEGMDLAFKIGGIAGAAWGYSWVTATAKSCGPCFDSEGINSSTLGCVPCYQSIMISSAGAAAAVTAIVATGGSVLKSIWKLAFVDIPEARSESTKEGLRPTAEQQRREAERVSLYLTLRLHGITRDKRGSRYVFSASDFAMDKVRQYRGICMDVLKNKFEKGSEKSLVYTIYEDRESFK